MYNRENLPDIVTLMLSSFRIERDQLDDLFIKSCNEGDGHGLWNDIRKLASKNDTCDSECFNDKRKELAFFLSLNREVQEAKEKQRLKETAEETRKIVEQRKEESKKKKAVIK